jgi:5'-nucleotidase
MRARPVLLLTNDDGVHARGLSVLRESLGALGDVIVVAPAHEQSGTSHAITIDRPLRHVEHASGVHSIDGTPADCIYLALFEPRFLPRKPDLVVSGINHGSNVGTSVFYSGTIAGAREGALRGMHAIAFSHDGDVDAPFIGRMAHDMVARSLSALFERSVSLPEGTSKPTLINVNFPSREPLGVKLTRVGQQVYEERVTPRLDPGGREYFWIGGKVIDYGEVDGSDKQAIDEGYVSVTPLALEPTDRAQVTLAAHIAGPDALSAFPSSETKP